MAGVKIYGVPPTRTFRPIWVALELGIEHELVPVDRAAGQNRTPEFLKLNPNGTIPVLVDGDFVLWESMAIDLYLVKKYDNGKGLAPRDLKEEALVLQWTLFTVNTLEQPAIDWALNDFVLPADKRDAKVADAALAKMQAPLKVLDDALKTAPWLVGNRFTVADLNVAAAIYRLLQMDLTKYPAVDAWLDRCYARPAAVAARKMRE
jgi:glutathione S-transferase